MNDKVFKRQLEKFGIEAITVAGDEPLKKRKIEFTENNTNIIRALMNTMEGREWVYNKLDFCCVFSTVFVPQDPYSTSFLCGVQEVGHHLNNEVMGACPDEYFLMIQEANARRLNTAIKKED